MRASRAKLSLIAQLRNHHIFTRAPVQNGCCLLTSAKIECVSRGTQHTRVTLAVQCASARRAICVRKQVMQRQNLVFFLDLQNHTRKVSSGRIQRVFGHNKLDVGHAIPVKTGTMAFYRCYGYLYFTVLHKFNLRNMYSNQ